MCFIHNLADHNTVFKGPDVEGLELLFLFLGPYLLLYYKVKEVKEPFQMGVTRSVIRFTGPMRMPEAGSHDEETETKK